MRKFLVVSIPIITLIFFVLIMLSGSILKNPLGNNDKFPFSINTIIEDVNAQHWEKAYEDTEKLDLTWNKIIKRVQFSSERDEINALSVSIARLKGAIIARDKASALMEINEAFEHWSGLGR